MPKLPLQTPQIRSFLTLCTKVCVLPPRRIPTSAGSAAAPGRAQGTPHAPINILLRQNCCFIQEMIWYHRGLNESWKQRQSWASQAIIVAGAARCTHRTSQFAAFLSTFVHFTPKRARRFFPRSSFRVGDFKQPLEWQEEAVLTPLAAFYLDIADESVIIVSADLQQNHSRDLMQLSPFYDIHFQSFSLISAPACRWPQPFGRAVVEQVPALLPPRIPLLGWGRRGWIHFPLLCLNSFKAAFYFINWKFF